MTIDLVYLKEPRLHFGFNQRVEDPRDGLALFGPLDRGTSRSLQVGVVGTKQGIDRFIRWGKLISSPVSDPPLKPNRPIFPGFQAIFDVKWALTPSITIQLDSVELTRRLHIDDGHKRVHGVVDLYAGRIMQAVRDEDARVDLWFVVVPEPVYTLCRPRSVVPSQVRVETKRTITTSYAKSLLVAPSLFDNVNEDAVPYQWDVNFHNQLKARLLSKSILTQVLRESTIAPEEFLIGGFNKDKRGILSRKSEIAWNVSTSIYYKLGGRPWKIADIRDGVCYVGLVFKRDERNKDPRAACCAAQMFLDSGDGVVFKGAVGPYYSPNKDEFHLKKDEAERLISLAMETYKQNNGGVPPREMFIHGKVRYSDEEWKAFQSAVDARTNLVGIRIREENGLKLFRKEACPILRGMAYVAGTKKAFLWTNGYIPRILTYPGREVPKPLLIDICRGDAEINLVLSDIMALTKLNYNSCIYADGIPVTLRFADAVGEILTAGPLEDIPPLSFKHYI